MQHDPEKEGFSIDVNRFTDWSQEEFDSIFATKFLNMEPEDLKISTDQFNNVNLEYITRKKKKEVIVSKQTVYLDWRTKGAVTVPRD